MSPATEHDYLSTACLHGEHDLCRLVCKYCQAACHCECHGEKREYPFTATRVLDYGPREVEP